MSQQISVTVVSSLDPNIRSTHSFPADTTLGDLPRLVPCLKDVNMGQFLRTINGRPAGDDTPLREGDRVAITPNAQKVAR